MKHKSVGVGVANTNSIVKDVTKFIMVILMSEKRIVYGFPSRYGKSLCLKRLVRKRFRVRFEQEDGRGEIVNEQGVELTAREVVDLLNEQQSTIEKQKRIIKSQDAEISRQYNLCLAMSGILREEFGVYDVFDRTKR